MGLTHPLRSRALAIPLALLLTTGALVGVESTAAIADPVPQLNLSTQALPTVQTDGVVWAQAIVGNTVYVGGDFTTATPLAGGAVARANVLAYDLGSGELISSFVANTNGAVRSVAASPDGSTIYIGGSFTSVNGTTRNRIAALNAATGAVTGFSANLNSQAAAIAATPSAVYVVGSFTQSNGVAVSKAAALNPQTGATLGWKPSFSGGVVRAVVVSPDRSIVLVAGGFTSVNGVHAGGMAATDASSGAKLPWAASSVVDLGGAATGIYSLTSDGTYVFGTGWAYQDKVGENSLEGAVSMKWNSGTINWIEDCHGDSYSSTSMNGILYVASHAHFCGNVPGGFGAVGDNDGKRATAYSVKASGVLAPNTVQGPGWYQSFGGQPAPEMMNFYPDITTGSFTGQGQAAWTVASKGNYVVYGGEFPKVNGLRQAGLVRFYEPATSPVDAVTPPSSPSSTPTPTPTPTPTGTATGPTDPGTPPAASKPNRVSKPDAIALGPSKVAVRWSAPKGAAADRVSGYVVKAYKGAKLVKKTTVGESKRLATISGLSRGTTYRISVAAKNSHGTGKASVTDSAKTKSKGKNVSATKKPAKVKKPTTSIGKGKLRIRWKAASAKGALGISKYQVRIVLHGNTVKTVTVSAKTRSKLVGGLKHKTGYTVSVRAGSWAGWGSWSSAKGAKTK